MDVARIREGIRDDRDPSSPDGWRLMETTLFHGELTQRLAENGLAEDDEVERRKVARAVLMGKAAGYQAIDACNRGEAVKTPPRPAPLVDPVIPVAKGRALPTLSEIHAKSVKDARVGKKAEQDNKLYVDRLIAMHGDLRIDAIERHHIREFRDRMLEFPSAMTDPIGRRSLDDVIAWADETDAPRLSLAG